ncbi:MAG: hypothetical protein JSV16_11915 [Candidatus Hydrogenedentota bacterium]|nr:MAG: hypothetical protein JSV16_11915 [Candidatus Hydrogenedentota bacterium]
MRQDVNQYPPKVVKAELQAWRIHVGRLRLDDRERFVGWLSEALTAQELALIIDSEVDRQTLWEIYLHEQYGS